MRRFRAQPPQSRWADRGFPWSGDGGGPSGEHGQCWSARIYSFGVALQRRHRVLGVCRSARVQHMQERGLTGMVVTLSTLWRTGVADIENMYSVLKVSERAQRVRRYTLPSRFNRSDALCLPRVHLHALSRPSAPPTRFNLGPDSRDQHPTKHRRRLNASHVTQPHRHSRSRPHARAMDRARCSCWRHI